MFDIFLCVVDVFLQIYFEMEIMSFNTQMSYLYWPFLKAQYIGYTNTYNP